MAQTNNRKFNHYLQHIGFLSNCLDILIIIHSLKDALPMICLLDTSHKLINAVSIYLVLAYYIRISLLFQTRPPSLFDYCSLLRAKKYRGREELVLGSE